MNCHFPLLHEPTFKRSIEVEEHLLDGRFGATVLLVCAIGSRFTRDPRVLLDGSDHHQSAGWKWFLHIERVRRMSFAPAKIYDLQIYVVRRALISQEAFAISHAPCRTCGIAHNLVPPRHYHAPGDMVSGRRGYPRRPRCRCAPQADVLPNSERRGRTMAAHLLVRFCTLCTDSIRVTREFSRILVSFEWIIGYGLGRPSCIHDEE